MDAQKVAWSAEAGRELLPALGEDLQEVAKQVQQSQAELWQWSDGYYMVTRLERDATGYELVIVAAVGRDFVPKVDAVVKAAKRRGWSVRLHSSRPGMGRLAGRIGFVEAERVYRVE